MADRYFVTGSGGNNNWTQSGAGSNWSLTDGGAGGQAVPTAADNVFFTSNSPNCISDGAGPNVCLGLNFTGYTNTITMTAQINVSGAMTFVSAMTISGSAFFRASAAFSHTSNGKTIPNLWFSGTATHTLSDNFTVTNLRLGITTTSTIVNGNQITINGDFDRGQATTGGVSGTTLLILAGTGTVTFPTSTGVTQNNLTINTSGTITFPASGTFRYNTGTFTYTAGTVVNTNTCDLAIATANTTLTLGANVPFQDISIVNTITVTLGADLYCRDFSHTLVTGAPTLNGSNIFISRTLSAAAMTTGVLTGTTVINMTGTGNINTDALTTGRINNPLIIDTSGTITFVSALSVCSVNMFNFKYVRGTVVGLYTWGNGPIGRNVVIQNIGTY